MSRSGDVPTIDMAVPTTPTAYSELVNALGIRNCTRHTHTRTHAHTRVNRTKRISV